jgi:hypothetical protein
MQFLCKITRYDMIPRLNLNRNVIATLGISGGSGWRADLDLHREFKYRKIKYSW